MIVFTPGPPVLFFLITRHRREPRAHAQPVTSVPLRGGTHRSSRSPGSRAARVHSELQRHGPSKRAASAASRQRWGRRRRRLLCAHGWRHQGWANAWYASTRPYLIRVYRLMRHLRVPSPRMQRGSSLPFEVVMTCLKLQALGE